MLARIRVIKTQKDSVTQWQEALTKVHGRAVGLFWTFGFVTDMPRLFGTSGFNSAESVRLLSRLAQLPSDAVDSLARTTKIAKARAAGSLVQQDWLWAGDSFDTARFQRASDALTKALAAK